MEKKIYIIGGIFLAAQIVFYVAKGVIPTQEEQDYRAAVEVYEGERAEDIQLDMQRNPGKFSEKVTAELEEQVLWMSDFEHALCTFYLSEAEGEKGYVYVPSSGEILGSEGFGERVGVPLMVYQKGWQYLFGMTDGWRQYIVAFFMIYFVMSTLHKKQKVGIRRQFLSALVCVVVTTLPELLWVLVRFGLRGTAFPVHSVAEIGGGSLAGMVRTLFLLRVLGVWMLEELYVFLNKIFWKKERMPARLIGIFVVMPLLAAGIAGMIEEGTPVILASSLGNLLVGSDAFRMSYEYVGILCMMAAVIIAFCRLFPVFQYTEEDIARMNRHFNDNDEKGEHHGRG